MADVLKNIRFMILIKTRKINVWSYICIVLWVSIDLILERVEGKGGNSET